MGEWKRIKYRCTFNFHLCYQTCNSIVNLCNVNEREYETWFVCNFHIFFLFSENVSTVSDVLCNSYFTHILCATVFCTTTLNIYLMRVNRWTYGGVVLLFLASRLYAYAKVNDGLSFWASFTVRYCRIFEM